MSNRYDVKIYYFQCPHLNQIYDGFARLEKQGIITLKIIPSEGSYYKAVLHTEINGKHVIYDTLDGLIWLDKSIEDNLEYFSSKIDCDYYFKRSYTELLQQYVSGRFEYYPLGLNYGIDQIGQWPKKFIRRIKDIIISNPLIEKLDHKKIFHLEDLEMQPIVYEDSKVLFLARLWNPEHVQWNERWYEERLKMNEIRLGCVVEGKKKFGDRFIGGIQRDEFSEKYCPHELLVPSGVTRRDRFLQMVKSSNICVATTGLFDSIGWKFGEYIAASRAVISEPLRYKLPGGFSANKNYLEFTNVNEFIEQCDRLLNNREMLQSMIRNNYDYYQNYVRSDKMIMNTLDKII